MGHTNVLMDVSLEGIRPRMESIVRPIPIVEMDFANKERFVSIGGDSFIFLVAVAGRKGIGADVAVHQMREAFPHAGIYVVADRPH